MFCNPTHAESRRRRRAILTAVDFTRGQSTQQLADRLQMHYLTVRIHLLALEKAGMVVASSSRLVLWTRQAA